MDKSNKSPKYLPYDRRIIRWIVLGLVVWGGLLAVGAYGFSQNGWQISRAVVVGSCMLGFLCFWIALLKKRQED
ncbi:MAG: hypothetical protein MK165_08085 [Pirellulaceae bacterium]|nr:hypothetical protein [Pirellulaceae bacterium]